MQHPAGVAGIARNRDGDISAAWLREDVKGKPVYLVADKPVKDLDIVGEVEPDSEVHVWRSDASIHRLDTAVGGDEHGYYEDELDSMTDRILVAMDAAPVGSVLTIDSDYVALKVTSDQWQMSGCAAGRITAEDQHIEAFLHEATSP